MPAAASTNAPEQTEAMRRTLPAARRSQAARRASATARRIAASSPPATTTVSSRRGRRRARSRVRIVSPDVVTRSPPPTEVKTIR